MSKAKYIAPSVELIQFGNEDLVCVISGWTPGNGSNFGVVEEDKDHPYTDGDF